MMNFDTTTLITIACVAFVIVALIFAIVYITKKRRNNNIDINIICNFSSKEADLIESTMEKYRCNFSELILLGVFQFQEEGRDLFDIIDNKRDVINGKISDNIKKEKVKEPIMDNIEYPQDFNNDINPINRDDSSLFVSETKTYYYK